MAFTLLKGTIHASLDAFDFELTLTARNDKFKDKNGIVVSLPVNHGIRYINATKTSRSVLVEGEESKNLTITFCDNNEIKSSVSMYYLKCVDHLEQVLDFLIDGVLPNVEQTGS